jgi:hypothetical protein
LAGGKTVRISNRQDDRCAGVLWSRFHRTALALDHIGKSLTAACAGKAAASNARRQLPDAVG